MIAAPHFFDLPRLVVMDGKVVDSVAEVTVHAAGQLGRLTVDDHADGRIDLADGVNVRR